MTKKNKSINKSADEAKYVEELAGVFCRIGKLLTASLEPKEVFQMIMVVIGEYFAPRHWSLLLREEETERLKFEIAMGVDADQLKDIFLEKGEGIAGWVCRNNQPLVVEDAYKDLRFCDRIDKILNFHTKSVVCVPLLNGYNRVIGAIELINKITPKTTYSGNRTVASFTVKDMAILSAIGAFAGVAIENAFLHQKVKKMAIIDSLTGLHNRHYFNEEFRCEIERVKRYEKTICVLLMDVDGLKTINDNYGHLIGDKALCAIADILKSSVRESDILARFGGDEFVVLIPSAEKSDGVKLLNRIQKLIEQWNREPSIPGVNIGLSVGVYSAGSKNIDNILEFADQDLYEFKKLRKKSRHVFSENHDMSSRYIWNKA